jgi:hypothetical protein
LTSTSGWWLRHLTMTRQPSDRISLVVGLPKGTLQVKQLLSASGRRNSLCVDRMFMLGQADKAGLVNSSLYFVFQNNLIRASTIRYSQQAIRI